MKLTVATLALCNALAPAPQRPPQTRRALLAKSGIAAISLAGPLVALPEAANAGPVSYTHLTLPTILLV